MSKIKVGVAGYGVIGQRLADGVARQGDMELVGVADLAPTLSIRALKEQGMPYDLYLVDGADKAQFDACGIPVSGTFEELIDKVDIMLDSSPGGVGAKNKELYVKHNTKAIFQGGEKNSVADVFFHGYANYEKGVGQNYLKLTGGVRSWFRLQKSRWKDRKEYRYYRCRECKAPLRVPKGKGNIRIRCPKCRYEMQAKS